MGWMCCRDAACPCSCTREAGHMRPRLLSARCCPAWAADAAAWVVPDRCCGAPAADQKSAPPSLQRVMAHSAMAHPGCRLLHLITQVPEHTWGVDIKDALSDYENWANGPFHVSLACCTLSARGVLGGMLSPPAASPAFPAHCHCILLTVPPHSDPALGTESVWPHWEQRQLNRLPVHRRCHVRPRPKPSPAAS